MLLLMILACAPDCEVHDWYPDRDGDGYGTYEEWTIRKCEGPVNHVANMDDCHDGDDTIYPGAPENWYDGLDSDCADDNDMDADADGFDAEIALGPDCDDNAPAVNPDAAEACDGLDNNCDGSVDEGCDTGG